MTVRELIKKLESLDPNAIVFTYGTESGYDAFDGDLTVEEFALNCNGDHYGGKHELWSEVEDDRKFGGDYYPDDLEKVLGVAIG